MHDVKTNLEGNYKMLFVTIDMPKKKQRIITSITLIEKNLM